MKREIKKVAPNIYRVRSEPGDATRYDYLIYRDGPNEYTFAPTRSTFNFPQRMHIFAAANILESEQPVYSEAAQMITKEFNANPFTVTECARAIVEISNSGEKWEHE